MKIKPTFLAIFMASTLFTNAQTQFSTDFDGASSSANFGISVSYSGDGQSVAIGANTQGSSGQVKVYTKNGNSWQQKGASINGEAGGDASGTSVDLSHDGNVVAIGAPNNDGGGFDGGHVRVYTWSGSSWIKRGNDIDAGSALERFGYALSLSASGNRIAIGAYLGDAGFSNNGYVKVFDWNGTSWVAMGSAIPGLAAGDRSGYSLSLSDDGLRVLIGSYKNDANGSSAGQGRVFSWTGTNWSQLGSPLNGLHANERLGEAVSISGDGNTIALGAPNDSLNLSKGLVRVYTLSNGVWIAKGMEITGESNFDFSGISLQLNHNGNRITIGAKYNDGTGTNSGHARIYDWIGTGWVQIGTDIDGEAPFDEFGTSIALDSSGSNLIVGGPKNDGGGTNSGHARTFSLNPLLNVSLSNQNMDSQLELYPNPFHDEFQINWDKPFTGQLELYSAQGKLVWKKEISQNQLVKIRPNIAQGVYFLRLNSRVNGLDVYEKKIIKL